MAAIRQLITFIVLLLNKDWLDQYVIQWYIGVLLLVLKVNIKMYVKSKWVVSSSISRKMRAAKERLKTDLAPVVGLERFRSESAQDLEKVAAVKIQMKSRALVMDQF